MASGQSVFRHQEVPEQSRDGTDPRPGHSSAGWYPGAVKNDLNSGENTQCHARDLGYFHSSKADSCCTHSMRPREHDNRSGSFVRTSKLKLSQGERGRDYKQTPKLL